MGNKNGCCAISLSIATIACLFLVGLSIFCECKGTKKNELRKNIAQNSIIFITNMPQNKISILLSAGQNPNFLSKNLHISNILCIFAPEKKLIHIKLNNYGKVHL